MFNFHKASCKIMTTDGPKERKGYTFNYMLGDGSTTVLGVHKENDLWIVDDLECGLRICEGRTRGEAAATSDALRARYTAYRMSPGYREAVAKFAKAIACPGEPYDSGDKPDDTAITISLEYMELWCDGKGLEAHQTHEGCNVWITGPSKPYKDELKGLGFHWGKSKRYGKGWFRLPTKE